LRDLAIVFAIAWGIRLIWAVLIPPWASPDEPAHFAYVAHLVEQDEIPHEAPYDNSYPEFSDELSESAGNTLLGLVSRAGAGRRADLAYFPVHRDYRPARRYKREPEARHSAAAGPATPYPPFYYLLVSGGYVGFQERPVLSRLFAVRAISGVMGALCACFAYLLAYELRRERRWGRAVGLSMALFPMHAFITASVNNDAGVGLAATALCWLLAKVLLTESVDTRLGAAVGLAGGAILMMKPSGVSVLLLGGCLLLWRAFPLRRGPIRFHWPSLRALVAFALTFMGTAGAWTIYRFTAHASAESDVPTQEGQALTQFFSNTSHSLLAYIAYEYELGAGYFRRTLVGTYWGNFGWLELPLPSWCVDWILICYAIAAVGLIMLMREGAPERRKVGLLLAMVLFNILFLMIAADYAFGFAQTGSGLGMQGRYFFPTLSCLLCLLCFGLARVFTKVRGNVAILPVFVATIQLVSLRLMLARWYGVEVW
jgi:hypothetical protein